MFNKCACCRQDNLSLQKVTWSLAKAEPGTKQPEGESYEIIVSHARLEGF